MGVGGGGGAGIGSRPPGQLLSTSTGSLFRLSDLSPGYFLETVHLHSPRYYARLCGFGASRWKTTRWLRLYVKGPNSAETRAMIIANVVFFSF